MTLPERFVFSQSNLQDYLDCPRRFDLRYVQRQRWPAVTAEPVIEHEKHMRQGSHFHQMVQQLLTGIPAEKVQTQAHEEPLIGWWHNFVNADLLKSLPETRYPEIDLGAPVEDARLIAKYDLLAVDPGRRLVIVDWKTSTKRTSRQRLQAMMQTRVYPYLLVKAGKHLNEGKPIEPQQVQMIYWFANHPTQPEVFEYSQQQYENDERFLLNLTTEIKGRVDFPKTEDTNRCKFCTYRSLCDRGVRAGAMDDIDLDEETETEDDLLNFDISLDQIAEVEF